MQQVLKYGGASVPESSYMHSLHQLILLNPLLPQQQTAASTTDVVHNQIHQEGPSYNLDIALQEYYPIPTVLGVQLNMNHFSFTAPQVGIGHAAPSLQRIPKQDAYNQASVAMATTQASIAMDTSEASAQSHGVYVATLTQGQWYHEPYQHYYQNIVGDYMKQQQPMQLQSFHPQNQVIYV
ncbi:hypothetical protein YC2023_118732 [Brassica napus]|uniref:Uncharacterized protein n=1 Tax=Brassica oleracea TaxID=3712 RepID=A0A3P6EJX2_BRAOL|nr:unnamed protein product [Brassica oleracea]